MNVDALTDALRGAFGGALVVRARRPGMYQVHVPATLCDGDDVAVFVRPQSAGRYVVTDLGHTLMRASYLQPLNTRMVEAIDRLAKRNGFGVEEGSVVTTVPGDELMAAVFGLVQVQAQAEMAVAAPVARMERADAFKQMVVEAIRHSLHDCEVGFTDKMVDPEGLFPIDVMVHGRRWVGVSIISNDNDASSATMAKLKHVHAPSLATHRPLWAAIPKDLESLTQINRRRLMSEFLPLTGGWANATPDEVTSKLRDLAEPMGMVS